MRAEAQRWQLRSFISARWWVYASSLPRGPAAMTSYPSPYALIHFTFIRTNNDFPPMKGREEEAETLVGQKWNLLPAMAIGCTLRKCCKGIYSYYWGRIGQEQQSFSPSHVRTLLYAAGTQTDWHMPKRSYMHTDRQLAHSHSGWWNDGSVHCYMLGSLYTD